MSRPETKQRILDTAEELFATDGFHRTSLRSITSRANVNLAAVNYHFGTKKALAKAVIERRLIPLNRIREANLTSVQATSRKDKTTPAVSDILRAFIEPTFRFSESGPGYRHFVTLVGRAFVEPDDQIRGIFMQLMRPVFNLMFESLCQALPDLPPDVVFCRLAFSMGAMNSSLNSIHKLDHFLQGTKIPSDTDLLLNMLLPFITAGMASKL